MTATAAAGPASKPAKKSGSRCGVPAEAGCCALRGKVDGEVWVCTKSWWRCSASPKPAAMPPTALEHELSRPQNSVLLLCSPHNPTGHVWTEDELIRMGDMCARAGVAVETSRQRYLAALSGDGLSSPAVLALVATIAAYRGGGPWLDALRRYLWENLLLVAQRLEDAFPQLEWQSATGRLPVLDRPLAPRDRRRRTAGRPDRHREAGDHAGHHLRRGRTLRLNVGCPRSKVERGPDGLIRALDRLAERG